MDLQHIGGSGQFRIVGKFDIPTDEYDKSTYNDSTICGICIVSNIQRHNSDNWVSEYNYRL